MSRRWSRRAGRSGLGGASSFSPLSLSPVLWLRADKGITLNGSNVSAWADQSGTGDANKDAVQGTAGLQPLYTASNPSINGMPTVGNAYGANTGRLSQGAWNVAPAKPLSILAVYTIARAAAGQIYVYDARPADSPIQCALVDTPGSDMTFYSSAPWAGDASSPSANGQATCVLAQMDATTPRIYVKSKSATQLYSSNPSNMPTGFTFGSYYGDTLGAYIGAQIAEIVMYDRVLTSGERSDLLDYVSARYAITVAP